MECGVAACFGGGGGVCGGNGVFGLGAEYAADGGGVYAGIVAVEHGVLAARVRVHGRGDGGAVGLGAVEGGVNGDERQPENGIWRFQAAFYAGAPDGFQAAIPAKASEGS